MEQHKKVWIPIRKKQRTTHRIINGPVIVLTPDELLDLMQEAIEHSYPTLLREKAEKLLASKLEHNG